MGTPLASKRTDTTSSSPPAPSFTIPPKKPAKRRFVIGAACSRCRTLKVKCDGDRPNCKRCVDRGLKEPCEYDTNQGESRVGALKKKNEKLQQQLTSALALVQALKSMPVVQAGQTLSKLRASSSADNFIEAFRDFPGHQSSELGEEMRADMTPLRDGNGSSPHTARQSLPEQMSLEAPSAYPHEDTASSTVLPYVAPDGTRLPDEALMRSAVISFFEDGGKLFQVFGREEIEPLIDQVYRRPYQHGFRLAISKLCGIGAVGVFYMKGPFNSELAETLFDKAKMCLDEVLEHSTLDGASICGLLGMKLLFSKNKAALTFVEGGLELCRRQNYHLPTRPWNVDEQEWRRGRKTWRMLFFIASWLSSTIGYLSANVLGPCEPDEHSVQIHDENSLEEQVQNEMVKISLLKFKILRMNLSKLSLSSLTIGAMSKELKRWYERTPPQMHLANAKDPTIGTGLRRTMYYVHLLYLGCRILLARRVIHSTVEGSPSSPDAYQAAEVTARIRDATEAASQSADILRWLRQEQGVFKRCWLCIQELLDGKGPSTVVGHFAAADSCLDVLEFCQEDLVAARFGHACRTVIFELRSVVRSPRSADNVILRETVNRLTGMLCAPFSNTAGDGPSDAPTTPGWQDCGGQNTKYDSLGLVVSLDQDFEAKEPFSITPNRSSGQGSQRSPGTFDDVISGLSLGRFLDTSAARAWTDA